MGLTGYDLSQYPLDEHYRCCRKYINNMGWEEISDATREKGTIGVDVSNAISLFPHLELDSEYRLICYMSSGYHGVSGSVVAICNVDDCVLRYENNKELNPDTLLNKTHIPECALPPMEAIFNDGSAEGYFEAVLFSLFINALPNTYHIHNGGKHVINTLPDGYEDAWEYQVTLVDYSPRYLDDTITVLTRRVENGLSGSDGKDRIYLSQFGFCKNVKEYLLWEALRTKRPIETKHITESNRYSEARKCCVFTESYVLVAREKYGV